MSDGGSSPESENGGLKRNKEDLDNEELVVTKKHKPEDASINSTEESERQAQTASGEQEDEVQPQKESAEVNEETDASGAPNEKTDETRGVTQSEESVPPTEQTESAQTTDSSNDGIEGKSDADDGQQTYLPTEAPPPLIQVLNPITSPRGPTPEILPRVDPRGQTDVSNKGLPPGIECGIVKWYDITKGFGFIQRESGDDVFIHQTSIPARPGQRGLADKEPVWFKVTKEAQGRLRAHDITGPHGAPLRGVPDVGLIPLPGSVFGAPLQHPVLAMPVAPTPSTNPNDFPPHTTVPLPPNRQRGFAKWFNIQKGFGFIAPEDGTDDIFCHQSNLLCVEGAFRSLAEKENLEFEIMDEPNQAKAKRKATNVTGPGGRPVVGVPKPADVVFPGQTPAFGVRPFQPPVLGPRGAQFVPPGLPQGPEARPPTAADPYASYYSQYFASQGQQPQQSQSQHPQFQQQQMLQQQQYQQQMLQQQQYQNPEHAAAWAAYYASQAAAGGAQGQQAQAQSQGAQGQPAAAQSQPGEPQQTAEHQAAWQAYYAQLAALQAQQGQQPTQYPSQ